MQPKIAAPMEEHFHALSGKTAVFLNPILTIPLAHVSLVTFSFLTLQGDISHVPSHSVACDIFLYGKIQPSGAGF